MTDYHHGHANGALVLAAERYNQPTAIDKFAAMTQAMGVDTTGMIQLELADRWFDKIEQLLQDIEIQPGYLTAQFGFKEDDIDHIYKTYANDFRSRAAQRS
ncbi:MAG: iron-containing alcohol dehydrogenase [Deltaproteobacteria bacterium]|nr:iron-containing alcohol dehydrogenase [Deltaproteobacteria bacterium]